MTIKIAVDNTNVEQIPVGNLRDVAGMARRLGQHIDEGEWGTVDRVVCILENENGIHILGWGENTTAYELMGMFEAAKLRVFAEDFSDE